MNPMLLGSNIFVVNQAIEAGYAVATADDPTTDELVDDAGNFLVDDADNNLVAAA